MECLLLYIDESVGLDTSIDYHRVEEDPEGEK
jgi:hypothetical protein